MQSAADRTTVEAEEDVVRVCSLLSLLVEVGLPTVVEEAEPLDVVVSVMPAMPVVAAEQSSGRPQREFSTMRYSPREVLKYRS